MKIYLLIILMIIVSCNKKMTNQELCETLSNLYENDQKYRGSDELEDPFFKVFDSIRKIEGISKEVYMKYSNEKQLAYGRKIRAIVEAMEITNQKVQDSLMDLQQELDINNTEKLLEIVKEYGFPDIKKLGCKDEFAPFLIFVHSPEPYWKEIKEVIDLEKKEKRIGTGDYDYISWHINGRKGTPIKIN